jgi:hypothetical protein
MYRSSAKYEAQDQLAGKTHYVDDSTLRFHKARVLSCDIAQEGTLFWLIESVAMNMHNTRRGFRYVVFDVFGNVVERCAIEDCFKSSKVANKALKAALAVLDGKALTLAGIKSSKDQDASKYTYLINQLDRLKSEAA